jgi:hypothetical protein
MAQNSQGFMNNGGINAYFSRVLPVKADGYSKKSAFDNSAGVSAVCAKVSLYNLGKIFYPLKISEFPNES